MSSLKGNSTPPSCVRLMGVGGVSNFAEIDPIAAARRLQERDRGAEDG